MIVVESVPRYTRRIARMGNRRPVVCLFGGFLMVFTCLILTVTAQSGEGVRQPITLYISAHETIQLTSPLHPSEYPNNADITWIVRAQEDRRIRAHFSAFSTETCCDFFQAGDGQGSRNSLRAFFKWSGDGEAPDLLSAGSAMWLRFTSDGSVTKSGFSISLRSVPITENLTCSSDELDCGHSVCVNISWVCGVIKNDLRYYSRGEFNLKDCLDGRVERLCGDRQLVFISADETTQLTSPLHPGDYPNNADITWIIKTQEGSKIRGTFSSFRTELCCDILRAGDGLNSQNSSTIFFEWRGDGGAPDLLSAGIAMWLRFTSNSYNHKPGFSLLLHSVPVTEHLTCSQDEFDCGHSVCVNSSWLSENVGAYDRYSRYLRDCFDESRQPIYINANETTRLTTPGYGGNYPDYADITWIILTQEDRRICTTFSSFRTHLCCDVLRAGDGQDSHNSSTIFFEWRGDRGAPNLYSAGNVMWLRFTSNSFLADRGFSFSLRSVPITETLSCSSDDFDCGHSVCVKSRWMYEHVEGYSRFSRYLKDCFNGGCKENAMEDASVGRLTWPVTVAGTQAKSNEKCPLTTENAGYPKAVRACTFVDGPPLYVDWGKPEIRDCGATRNDEDITVKDVADVPVSPENVVVVAKLLVNLTAAKSKEEAEEPAQNLGAVSEILQNILATDSGDTEVTSAVLQTVNNVILGSSDVQNSTRDNRNSSTTIIKSVEKQVSLTLRQEGRVSIRQETIQVEAVNLDPMQLARNGLGFASVQRSPGGSVPSGRGISLNETEVEQFVHNSSMLSKSAVEASIQLPATVFDQLQSVDGDIRTLSKLPTSYIAYENDALFQSARIMDERNSNSSLEVGGFVISLTVEDVVLENLSEPVIVQFRAPDSVKDDPSSEPLCVFWDFRLEHGIGDWSEDGCVLAENTNDAVSCHCDHLTNFAILVSVQGKRIGVAADRALTVISQIGGSLSIVSLAVTLMIYCCIRKLRMGRSRQIFIHFCVSLLVLYIVFLAGVDGAKGSKGGCVFVAALLHYLTLSTMMWMAVEARNMYVSTVKVFPEDTSRYMAKACLMAWGCPLLVVAITLPAAFNSYSNDDNGSENRHYCFIKPGLAMYLGLLLPVGLILVHNIVTFVLVMRSLLKVKEHSRSKQISRRLQNAIGISALMGLTWVFGFLAIDSAAFAFQLIFCLANSLQGVIIFVMFCARPEEVRAAVTPYLRRLRSACPERSGKQSYDVVSSMVNSETEPSVASFRKIEAIELSASGPSSAAPSGVDTSIYEGPRAAVYRK